jgi:hypothetical protein
MVAVFALTIGLPAEAQWFTHEFRDSFDRRTPAVMVHADAQINNRVRPETGRATLVIRRNDAYVVTGDSYICHSPPNNPVRLSLQVDGGRVLDTQGIDVSTDKRAIFFGQSALNMILAAQREIRMETRDHCGATVSISFGAVNLQENLNHVGRRSPTAPPAQGQQPRPAQPAQAAPLPSRLIEGRAALAKRDFAAAEAAAREIIATGTTAHMIEARMLLGDALLGKRDFADAAKAYDDARRQNPSGARAAEAAVGIANAFVGLSMNREACTVLAEGRIPASGPLAERAADTRRRAGCR